MYDIIVAGARCAGAPTAMLLARKGYRVLLVDRATFPSDIPHGHFIHRGGPRALARWGLLDRIAATGCPPVDSITSDYGDGALSGTGLAPDGIAVGYAPRRWALDRILVEAAVEAGAELRTGFSVQEFIGDGERITGIRGRSGPGRATVTERATLTIGADGRNSKLARTVGAPARETAPAVTCWYFSYWSGLGGGLELYHRGNKVILAFPTNNGLTGIFIAWAAGDLPRIRADVEHHFMAAVNEVPAFAERVRNGRREERFFGASDVPNFLRKPHGPGWALVGDAGCHKDPFLALGICDAFRDAELLADAVDQGLSGRTAMESALGEYERLRDAATAPDYRLNLQLARFQPPPPEMLLVRVAVRGDQDATRQYFYMTQGVLPREQFLASENIRRLLAQAAAGV